MSAPMTELGTLTLEQALDLALAAVELAQTTAAGPGIDTLDQDETLLRLRQLQRITFLLGGLRADLERHAYHSGRRGRRLVEGLGQVRVYRTDSRTRWDERGACQAAIDHLMESHPDGDLPTPWQVVETLLEAGAFSYFRTGVLRSWGVDPDQLSDRVRGRPAVALPPLES